ncbi:MAG: hypothetical protein V4671_02775 [Armatimonadota bacterium]
MAETEPGITADRSVNELPAEDFNDVIGGSDILGVIADNDIKDDSEDVASVAATHPGLAPIQGGDVSDAPAAQPGTRGEGTGADTGTGAELGTTRPGGSL